MKILPKLTMFLLLVILVSACTPSASPTVAPPTSTVAPTPTQDAAATAAAESNRLATSVAATLTAIPTSTSLPTSAPTETLVPTPSSAPPSATAAPTSTKVVVATQVAPTKAVVATATPTEEAASGSVYRVTGGGPQGSTSTLFCTQVGGTACQPTMPPGDLSFAVTLESSMDALEVIFYPFGLSVEKDGANAADMYMTADAGWLPPGARARFGTSRTFSQPGHYVVRTNGCLFTQENYASGECTWWTLNGTVVTFDIR